MIFLIRVYIIIAAKTKQKNETSETKTNNVYIRVNEVVSV